MTELLLMIKLPLLRASLTLHWSCSELTLHWSCSELTLHWSCSELVSGSLSDAVHFHSVRVLQPHRHDHLSGLMTTLVPQRTVDVVKHVVRAVIAANIACFLTARVAGRGESVCAGKACKRAGQSSDVDWGVTNHWPL